VKDQTPNDQVLVKLSKCTQLLAECKTVSEAKQLSDISEAARVYAKRIGASFELINRAAEYKIRAERKLGEILEGGEKNKGEAGQFKKKTGGRGSQPPINSTPTIAELGLTKEISARSRKLKSIPDKEFETALGKLQSNGTELSTARFLKAILPKTKIDHNPTYNEDVVWDSMKARSRISDFVNRELDRCPKKTHFKIAQILISVAESIGGGIKNG